MNLKEKYQRLSIEIDKKIVECEETIFKLLRQEEPSAEDISEAIWKILEDVFSLILTFIKENYPSIKADGIDIISCMYQDDNKTIEDRAEVALTKANPLPHLCLIVENESYTVLNSFLVNTVAKEAKSFEIIQSTKCCEYCNEQYASGVHNIGKLKEIPPFHVDCNCLIVYYTEEG